MKNLFYFIGSVFVANKGKNFSSVSETCEKTFL